MGLGNVQMGHEVRSRLYLLARAGADLRQLGAMLEATGAATLLITADASGALGAAAARPLVELAQARDVAALIEGDAQLARTLRADGVHLPWSKDIAIRYAEARDILGTRFIVGADVGRSRHDAMTLAEDGADYIGFGIPAHVEDRLGAAARRLELVDWWSEIFEVPCVAFDVEDAEAATALAAAGADFIAMAPDAAPPSPDAARALARSIAEASAGREALA
jgi:thiamine-phosphate pyrophosphorylase